ncbi:swr complex subunit [Sporothrix eucalyptigena]|uniref:SWR1-complex protein 5 n=1 Tax=Sporothrix eucalyptigena TaxID=1812306 RepID=A0ABP0AXT8_9PEZI
MSAPDVIMDDENYASSEDSDFAPDAAPDAASAADSDSEDEAHDEAGGETTKTQQARITASKRENPEAEDAGFENSGDEAIIGKGKKRRRKDGDSDGEDGGVGGFVKTRNQRANEKAERRAAAVQGPVTVDVDALWSQMMGGGSNETKPQTDLSSLATAAMFAATARDEGESGDASKKDTEDPNAPTATTAPSSAQSEMIKIRRIYNFAGEVHTEEKIVARDSAEAKLYLAEVGTDSVEIVTLDANGAEVDAKDGEDDQPKRLPPRKAFRSAFEPILDPSLVQIGARTDLDLGLAARLQARERTALQKQQQAAYDQAKKLTTVEKSRMDWAGFVDREGIQDELAVAGKSKGAFVDRQQFLARTEMRREEEARRARMAGKV